MNGTSVMSSLSAPSLPRSVLGSTYRAHLSDLATAPGDLIQEAAASELLEVAYRGRFLATPVFLSVAERARVATDLRIVHRLLTSLPERLFDGDVGELARAVGMTPTQVSVVRRATAGAPLVPLARSDLYRDANGFKLLELNITSALGGFENADINRAMLRHPALAKFVAAQGLGYADTLQGIVSTLRAECAPFLTGDRPVVALVDWPDSYRSYEPRLRVLARLLDPMGIDAVPCHVGQLRGGANGLEIAGRRVDAVFRFFLVEEIATPRDAELVEPVLRAVEAGAVGMFSRLDAELYGNKGALAMVSDDRNRSLFTAEELECVDRFLPWTRYVRSTVTTEEGEQRKLMELAVEQREELILKPTLLHGGSGITAGWTVPEEQWTARLAEAMGGPYVIQRRVRPQAETFPRLDGGGTEDLYLNWGVFMTDSAVTGGDGYGGCIVRGSTDPSVGVVSMSSGARVGCCFHELHGQAPDGAESGAA
jgi:hypothetical protein